MANRRLLVKRLKAVRNIRKITRTMELIATSRFKKALDRATEAAEYTRKISEIVGDLGQANLKFSHPLLEKHPEEKRSVLLVLTANRGLCGGYNASVLRQTLSHLRTLRDRGTEVSLEVSGKRGIKFLNFQRVAIAQSYTHFEDKTSFADVEVLASRYVDDYIAGRIDRRIRGLSQPRSSLLSLSRFCPSPALVVLRAAVAARLITSFCRLRKRFWLRLCQRPSERSCSSASWIQS